MPSVFPMKNKILLSLSILLTVFGKFFTPFTSLSSEANTALFFMISLVIIIATETLPGGLTALTAVVLLPILGLTESLSEAAALFGNQLFFYTLSCYAISSVMGKLPLSKRILLFFLKKYGKSTKGTISALLLTTAILSSFVSNFPAALLVLMISKQYLRMIENKKDRLQMRGSLMIGIIVSVAIGGIVTPVGSSSMALASTFLKEAGYPITFAQWILFGLPVAIIWFPIALFILFKFLPPPEQDAASRKKFIDKVEETIPTTYSTQEKLTLVILCVTFLCWILNFNLMLVTCFCCVALLFPGFQLINWKEFSREVGWSTIMMICALVAVVSVLQKTGVIAWLLELFIQFIPTSSGPSILLLIFGIFTGFLLVLMPNAPALVTIVGSAIIPLAIEINIHPSILLIGFAFYATFGCIFPIDTLSLAIYEEGQNFQAKDRPRVAIPITIAATVITSIWLPVCAKLLGLY